MATPEHLTQSPENNLEAIGEAARNRSEELRGSHEKSAETGPESGEKQAERARAEALESAVSVEAGGAERRSGDETRQPARRRGVATKRERQASFKHTMDDVQSELSTPSRVFSKVIHNPAVEYASEAIGKTIARPNAILAGSFTALVLTFGLYMIAKRLGYPLSGFETIGAFIIGWAIGLLYDYLRTLITGKK